MNKIKKLIFKRIPNKTKETNIYRKELKFSKFKLEHKKKFRPPIQNF